jgi:creatinine amidohydrolase
MTKFLLAEMTWPEVRDVIVAGRVLLQPVAAIEQHGPHLPVDADNRITTAILEEVGRRSPDEFVVAPCIPYGFNDHNMEFPGTVSVRPSTFLEYCYDAGHSFATMGFRRILWLNGHGSNRPLVELAVRRITTDTPAYAALADNIWAKVDERLRLRTSPLGGVAHACEQETSFYLHLRPDLVREDLIADEYPSGLPEYVAHDPGALNTLTFMSWYSQRTTSGVDGAPSHASREKGRAWFEAAVELVTDIARSFREMDLPPRHDERPGPAWAAGLRSVPAAGSDAS